MNLDFSELQREIHKVHEKSLHEESSGSSRKDVRDFKLSAPDRVGAVNRYTMFMLPYLDSRGVPSLGRELHSHFIVLGEQRLQRTCMERTVVNGTTKPCPFCYTIKSVANMTGNKDLRKEIFSYSANGSVFVNILPWALNSQRYNFSQNPGDGLPPYLPHVLRLPLKQYNKIISSIVENFPTPPLPFDPMHSNAVMIEVEKKGTRKMNIAYNASWAPNLRQALVPPEHVEAFLSQCYKLDEIYKAATDEQYAQQAEEAKIFAQHLHGILGGATAPAAAPVYGQQPGGTPTFAPAPTQAYVMAPAPAPTLTVPAFQPQQAPAFQPAPAPAPAYQPAPAPAPVYQQQPQPQYAAPAPAYQPAPAAPVYQPAPAAPAYQPPPAAPVYQPAPQPQQYEQPQQQAWAPPAAAPAPLASAPLVVPPAMAAFAPPSIAPIGQPTQTNTMPEGAGAPSSPAPFAPPPAQGFQQG